MSYTPSIATASGPDAVAEASSGGKAVAISNGTGAAAHAISTGGYAESVAIGNGAQSRAFAPRARVDIDRTEVNADGQPMNRHYEYASTSSYGR